MLTRRFKLLYSLGDIATAAPLTVLTFYSLFFMTDVAGMSPGRAGLAVALGRAWDAINDPIYGLISDRIRSPRGRRRVVILFAAIPIALAYLLHFFVPDFSEWGKVAYYTFSIILFDTLFTMIHVSYNALTPAITQDYDEQSSLNGYRMTFNIFGGLLGIVIATALTGLIPDQQTRFLVLGASISLLMVICLFVVYSVTEPYDSPVASSQDQLPPLDAMRATLSNKPFRWLMALYLFSWTAVSIVATVFIFFAQYYLGQDEFTGSLIILAAQISAILFMPFWVWFAQKYDKRKAFLWGCFSWIFIQLGLFFVQPDQLIFAIVLAAMGGAGVAVAYFAPWAMIPDVVELDAQEHGERREGAFYAFAAFFQKLGTGLAVWLLGMGLEVAGYITPEAGEVVVQPESAVFAIRLAISVVPAVLVAIAIYCAWQYPIMRTPTEA